MLAITALLSLAFLAPQDVDEKSSPFDGLRWSGDQPEVLVEKTWYEPVAIDGVAVEEILALADKWSPGREKRFAEDLVPILVRLDWKGDRAVDLDLRSLEDGSAVRLVNVEMTRAKREALRGSRNAREARPAPLPASISAGDALADIEAFGAGLKDQFAYVGLGEVDLDRELDQIRDGLGGDRVDFLDLRLQLHRLLMRFGDGHAQIRSSRPLGQPGDRYLPFLLVDSAQGVVAVLPDRSALVEPATPVVRAIDGKTMDEWVELARSLVANGSPQLVRRRVLGDMREIDFVRRSLGEETGAPLTVTFSSEDGSETVERELDLSSRRPTYGTWPRSRSTILEGNIGYLRIAQMDGEVDPLREAMEEFVDTDGLIVDVRGNGGGTRELLLALGGYLIGPKEPAVVGNIAQYRLSPRFDEGHLEARYMHRADWEGWSDRQRVAIRRAASEFTPEWQPEGEFSEWHYLVLDHTGHPAEYPYDSPVVVLSDSGCFSATDIFLGALELLPRVTLLGTASSGGSARSQSFRLPKTGMEVRCASMASFRPDGRLYDGRGIEVDVEVQPAPLDFLSQGSDSQLKAALESLGGSSKGSKAKGRKLTRKERAEFLGFFVGQWTGTDKASGEVVERGTFRWIEEGRSVEGESVSYGSGAQAVTIRMTYEPKLGVFIHEVQFEAPGLDPLTRHLHWDPREGVTTWETVSPELSPGIEHRMVERRTGPDTTEIQFTAFEFGEQVYESSVLYARGAEGSDGGGQDAGRALVEALASSLAGNDYEAFKSLTCLGMGKEDFKQFMQENPDRKVLRVWDSAKDDFKAELKVEVREAFDLAQKGARAFDWSQAEVRSLNWEQEGGGDVKATLVSGSLGALIKLDDCFMTPMGLLTFEAPVGGVMPVERLPRDF